MITVIVGNMRAGKSEKLINLIDENLLLGKNIKIFYPQFCVRENNYITSNNGKKYKAIPIIDPISIYSHIGNADLIVIDEISFINNLDSSQDDDFLKLLDYLTKKNIDVVLAGLDLDFRGQSFPIVNKIMAYADIVEKLMSRCDKCNNNFGRRTVRLINGEYADIESEDILVMESNEVSYLSVCTKCYNNIYGN